MPLQIAPILSTLSRHKFTATLMVLQIALTCAIICNAVFLISDRLRWMDTPSGIDEDRIVRILVSDIGRRTDVHARVEADLAALRAVPGVEAATVSNSVPFGSTSWSTTIKLTPDQRIASAEVAAYYGENIAQTFGTRLVAGRYIQPDEYTWIDDFKAQADRSSWTAMLTQDLANKLFPGESAVGKSLIIGDATFRIVGVVDRLAQGGSTDTAEIHHAVLLPYRMIPSYGAGFTIRARPGEAARALTGSVAALKAVDPRRVIVDKRLYPEIRSRFFAADRATTVLLVGICVALLVVTALGIVGLASFWVAQRRRQIGVRRALGARRVDVLRYFQTENFLLASMGVALGMALAYGINLIMMRAYELPRLPLYYLPIGAVVLWLLGQAAVLAPALRAASVPPVEATRG
ncbi:MAG TPA: ABC transporter permease [Luteibacter sp.]|nr:ABC transporter permease [Luteibacter sp.]